MEMFSQRQVMRQINNLIVLLCALISMGFTGYGYAKFTEFDARYKAFQYGKELGHATLKLESLGRNKYRLEYKSDVSMFFLSDKRKEVSLFTLQNEKIIPYKYNYERTGFGSDKELSVQFDPNRKLIEIDQKGTLPWDDEFDNQLYRLDVQRQLAQNEKEFSYSFVNYRGEIRHYDMIVLGKEQLELPFGLLEGIKVKIMRESSTRETFAWFAPSLNYQLVRLQQFKEGEEQGDIQLSEFSAPKALLN